MKSILKASQYLNKFVSLNVNICGLELPNPLLPAAGPPVKDAKAMIDCIEGGAGGVVAKTVSVEPAVVPRPCMIKVPSSKTMLNHELWSDMPVEDWIGREYGIVREAYPDVPFIGSAGYNAEEIRNLAPRLVEAGAQALELSIHYLGGDPKSMVDSIKAAKESTGGAVPVFPKLSPNIIDIKEFALHAQDAGADGIVAINSVGPCLGINIETGMAVTGGKGGYGWLSGQAVKPIAVRCVYEIASVVDIPVIAVGGVFNGNDAIEMMMAGASAVQICTAAIYEGPGIFNKINKQIVKFMEKKGYNSLDEIVGLAVKNGLAREDPYLDVTVPTLDEEKCVQCGECSTKCIYGAITMEDYPVFDSSKCYGCGLCASFCKVNALSVEYWK